MKRNLDSLVPTPLLPKLADGSLARGVLYRCKGSGVHADLGMFFEGELRAAADPLVRASPGLFERWTPPPLPVMPLPLPTDGGAGE